MSHLATVPYGETRGLETTTQCAENSSDMEFVEITQATVKSEKTLSSKDYLNKISQIEFKK